MELNDNIGEFSRYITGTLSTLLFLILVGALICNVLVALVIARKCHLRSNSSNKFVFNLCTTNSVLSVVVLPFVLTSTVKQRWIFGDAWCQTIGFFTILLCTNSLLTAMILSIDRYHCIVNPLTYTLRMSPSKTKVLIIYTWLHSLFIAILPLVGWGKYGYQRRKYSCTVLWESAVSEGYTKLFSATVFIIPFMIMCWAYYHILKAARRQSRIGQAVFIMNGPFRSSVSSTVSSSFTGFKALRTTILVLGNIVLCWGVYVVTILLESSKIQTTYGLQVTAMILNFSSSFTFPIIYGIRVKGIRRHLRKFLVHVFCCCCGYDNTIRPICNSEAGFHTSVRTFRNRSVSDGSVASLEFEGGARVDGDVCVGWCLPAIVEETDDSHLRQTTELTDLEPMSFVIPGQIPE